MTVGRARRLRQRMTDAERKLWAVLRDRRLHGFKFRRQHPLGPYVLDFFDETHKLVVEVDGGQHADHQAEDAARTAWLEKEGCRVLRFWNNDVLGNLDGVLQTIRAALPENPHPLAAARDLSQGRG
jgi:very-short-patch-repair endonuclease